MKKSTILFGLILTGILTLESRGEKSSSNNDNPDLINSEQNSNEIHNKIDPNSSPESVMNTIFQAAQSGEVGILKFLLPPYDEQRGEIPCDGDCKALSNYTRALLNAVDVPAYYTELYGDQDKIDIESDFFSVQGNHVILAIPNQSEYVFLECTSQDNPFGYQANFTDDRNVVVIKPEGGEIVRTKNYDENANSQFSKGNYSISETGDFEGKISIVSEGTQYGKKYQIEKLPPNEKERNYKSYWSNINNLVINSNTFINDKEKISFTENLKISAVNYGAISQNKILFAVNAFNQYSGNLKKTRSRRNPFEIERGFIDNDEIAISLPAGFLIEAMPENTEISNKFGIYKTEIIKKDGLNLVFKRKLLLKKGIYPKEDFEEFRLFIEKVRRIDNSKIVIAKI
jgi:hypothetical protein